MLPGCCAAVPGSQHPFTSLPAKRASPHLWPSTRVSAMSAGRGGGSARLAGSTGMSSCAIRTV